jgi:hypothetical protein
MSDKKMDAEVFNVNYEQQEQQDPIEVVFDADVPLREEQKSNVRVVVNHFAQLYNLWKEDYPQGIHFWAFMEEWVLMEWNGKTSTAAVTEWNKILFNTETAYATMKDEELINIVRHELGHTIPNTKMTYAFDLTTWDKITAVEWFTLHILTKDNIVTTFKLLEEAFCEVLAVDQSLNNALISYSNSDARYFAIGTLLMQLCRYQWITATQLVHFQKEGDMIWFTSALLGKQADGADIEYVINKFNELRSLTAQLQYDASKNPQLQGLVEENSIAIMKRIGNEMIRRQ